MARCINLIGGEFWFQKELFNKKINNFNNEEGIFLDGGQSSLHYIYKKLNLIKDEYVIMPSYLCPSMLIGLKTLNISYDFYSINKDLSIDINSIKNLIEEKKVRAVLFINYFGFYHNKETLNYLKQLSENGILLIEDAVQMLWFKKSKNFIGDFVFNSYRKFLSIDGSVLLCKGYLEYVSTQESTYSKTISDARQLKTEFINGNFNNEEEFLKIYAKAENEYYENIIPRTMIFKNKELLNNCDERLIKCIRIENFKFLEGKLKFIKEIKPLFDSVNIIDAPLGYPIFSKNRDALRNFLKKHNIFAPIHWNIKNEVWAENYKDSMFISNNILTIPIDQRYGYEDMIKIVQVIRAFYSKEGEDV